MSGHRELPAHRVLVVDDDPDITHTLQMLLTACGQTVRTALDGASALKLVAEFSPDLVLLDLGMPGMGGLEVAREIRLIDRDEQPFIVAMTGRGQLADRLATRDAGFDGHLVKPVTFNRLAKLLANPAAPSELDPGEPLPLLRGPVGG